MYLVNISSELRYIINRPTYVSSVVVLLGIPVLKLRPFEQVNLFKKTKFTFLPKFLFYSEGGL